MASVMRERVRPRARVASRVRQWLAEGQVRPGEALPSMQALGRELDVSPSTVLLAMRDLETEGLVRPQANGQRVVTGFRRPRGESLMARTVVLLTEIETSEIGLDVRYGGGWAQAVDRGVLSALRQTDLHLLVLRPGAMRAAEMEHLVADPPCGLLVTPSSLEQSPALVLIARLREAGTAVVGQGAPPDVPDGVDSVESDHEAGAGALTQWLAARGCRRILRVWPLFPGWSERRPGWLSRRDAGYERGCREAALAVLPALELPVTPAAMPTPRERFEHEAHAMAGRLWPYLRGPQPVDAIMAGSDGTALEIGAACRILGLEPGRDVTVVGYDNYWHEIPWRDLAPPPAATVDKDNAGLGAAMVELLRERLAGTLPAEAQIRLRPPELKVFRSP